MSGLDSKVILKYLTKLKAEQNLNIVHDFRENFLLTCQHMNYVDRQLY